MRKIKICTNEKSKIKDFKSLAKKTPQGNKRYKKTWRDFVCDDLDDTISKTSTKPNTKSVKREWNLLDYCKFNNDGIENYGIIVNTQEKVALHGLKIGMLVEVKDDETSEINLGIVREINYGDRWTPDLLIEKKLKPGEKYKSYSYSRPFPDDKITALKFDSRRWVYIDKKGVLNGPFTDDQISSFYSILDKNIMIKTIFDDAFFPLKIIQEKLNPQKAIKDYADKKAISEFSRTKDIIVSIYNSKEIIDINYSNIKFGAKKQFIELISDNNVIKERFCSKIGIDYKSLNGIGKKKSVNLINSLINAHKSKSKDIEIQSLNALRELFRDYLTILNGGIYANYYVDPQSCPNPTKSLLYYDENIRQDFENNTSKGDISELIKLSDGTCFNVNELAQTIIAKNGLNRHPYAEPGSTLVIWKNDKELEHIINHPRLSKTVQQELKSLTIVEIDLEKIYENKDILRVIGEVGLILLSDYEDGFETSNLGLAYLSNIIHNLDSETRNLFENIKTKSGKSLGNILSNIQKACIHGGGYELTAIYCIVFNKLMETQILSLDERLNGIHYGFIPVYNGVGFKFDQKYTNTLIFGNFVGFAYHENNISINLYDEKNSFGNSEFVGRVGKLEVTTSKWGGKTESVVILNKDIYDYSSNFVKKFTIKEEKLLTGIFLKYYNKRRIVLEKKARLLSLITINLLAPMDKGVFEKFNPQDIYMHNDQVYKHLEQGDLIIYKLDSSKNYKLGIFDKYSDDEIVTEIDMYTKDGKIKNFSVAGDISNIKRIYRGYFKTSGNKQEQIIQAEKNITNSRWYSNLMASDLIDLYLEKASVQKDLEDENWDVVVNNINANNIPQEQIAAGIHLYDLVNLKPIPDEKCELKDNYGIVISQPFFDSKTLKYKVPLFGLKIMKDDLFVYNCIKDCDSIQVIYNHASPQTENPTTNDLINLYIEYMNDIDKEKVKEISKFHLTLYSPLENHLSEALGYNRTTEETKMRLNNSIKMLKENNIHEFINLLELNKKGNLKYELEKMLIKKVPASKISKYCLNYIEKEGLNQFECKEINLDQLAVERNSEDLFYGALGVYIHQLRKEHLTKVNQLIPMARHGEESPGWEYLKSSLGLKHRHADILFRRIMDSPEMKIELAKKKKDENPKVNNVLIVKSKKKKNKVQNVLELKPNKPNIKEVPKVVKLPNKFIQYDEKKQKNFVDIFKKSGSIKNGLLRTGLEWLLELSNKNNIFSILLDSKEKIDNYINPLPLFTYIEGSKELLYFNEGFIENIKDKIDKSDKRYITFLLCIKDNVDINSNIWNDSNSGFFNAIIIDTFKFKIYRFDPRGWGELLNEKVDNVLSYFFTKLSPKNEYGPGGVNSWYNLFKNHFVNFEYVSPSIYQSRKGIILDNELSTNLALSLYFSHLFIYNNRNDHFNETSVNIEDLSQFLEKIDPNLLSQNIKGYMSHITKNIPFLEKSIKKKKQKTKKKDNNIQKCSLDGSTGICEKSDKQDQNCIFDKSDNMCIYSEKYMTKKPKDIILVLQSPWDDAGAFNANGDRGLFTIFKSLKEFELVHKKVSSLHDIIKVLELIPKNVNIAHLIIMAHGLQDSISLSSVDRLDYNNLDIFVSKLKPKLSPNCSILLHSCLVGKGGINKKNYAGELAKKLPYHTIFGSEEPISRNELSVDIARNDYNRRVLLMSYSIDTDHKKYAIYTFRYNEKGNFIKNIPQIKLDEREQEALNKETIITLELILLGKVDFKNLLNTRVNNLEEMVNGVREGSITERVNNLFDDIFGIKKGGKSNKILNKSKKKRNKKKLKNTKKL